MSTRNWLWTKFPTALARQKILLLKWGIYLNTKTLLASVLFTLLVATSGKAAANDPPTLPVVPVQGTGYSGVTVICTGMECAGLWNMGPQFDWTLDIDTIVVGVELSIGPVTDLPDSPLTQWNANCTSDADDRRSHANEDYRHAQLARQRAGQGPITGNVRVTYDDGGTEVWPVPGAYSSVVALAPVPGTLTCP